MNGFFVPGMTLCQMTMRGCTFVYSDRCWHIDDRGKIIVDKDMINHSHGSRTPDSPLRFVTVPGTLATILHVDGPNRIPDMKFLSLNVICFVVRALQGTTSTFTGLLTFSCESTRIICDSWVPLR